MSVVANVAINVDAGKALGALKGLDNAVKGLGSGISKVGQAMSGLAGIAASIGAGAALSGFIKAGIEADRTAKSIKALAGQFKETEGLTRIASQATKDFGLGQTTAAKSVTDLYGRLRPMGVSLEDIGKTFNGVNKAAALMNLTSADTEGVMLQLSQAMGSGALQGDELRSIMERLPAVGQAVAKVMGVTVGEIKQLGADGKITTDVIIKAMEELNKIQAPPPDAYKLFQKTLEDLSTTIGTQLLPAFTPLVQKISELANKAQELGVAKTLADALLPLADAAFKLLDAFANLNPEIQKGIIQFGAIAGVISLIIVPLGLVVQGIGALISALGTVFGLLSGASIFATIAGWLGALGPLLGSITTAVVAFFSGPVGWITLAVAAGVAIYAFRDQIGQAFSSIGQYFSDMAGGFQLLINEAGKAGQGILDALQNAFNSAVQFIFDKFVKPVQDVIAGLIDGIKQAFNGLKDAIAAPFQAAANIIRSILNAVVQTLQKVINGVVSAINRLIAGVNNISSKVGIPAIPFLEAPQLPGFAEGGYVTGKTLAMIGEGGEPEYVIPASKMQEAMKRYASGARGASVIPSSGLNGDSTDAGASSAINPQVSITTGPVMQMGNETYVTKRDLMSATQQAARQGANMALQTLQSSPSVRRNAGLAR